MTRSACLNSIYELAKVDNRVVFIGTDLAPNTLESFKRDFPERYFMCGIQEQNCIGLAAGLALEGFIPYVNNIASFLTRRCYEQIFIDICAHNLPVRLVGNGGGLVYAPLGCTHIAIEDMAIMRAIPNMQVICCSDNDEMKQFMPETLESKNPMYIRLGRDTDPVLPHRKNFNYFYTSYPDILVISTGAMSWHCIDAIENHLKHQGNSLVCDFLHTNYVKPLKLDIEIDKLRRYKLITVVEEGISSGGLGTAIMEFASENNIPAKIFRLGVPDAFVPHYGEQIDLLETYGLTPEKIAESIRSAYDSL